MQTNKTVGDLRKAIENVPDDVALWLTIGDDKMFYEEWQARSISYYKEDRILDIASF